MSEEHAVLAAMKLLFWNVDRLSAADKRTQPRFDRVMKIIHSMNADVVGLTEVSSEGINKLHAFARDHGYRFICREPDGLKSHAVLLVPADVVTAVDDPLLSINKAEKTVDSEALAAVLELPGKPPCTVAVVYNYSMWPTVLRPVHEFAAKHTGGNIVVGGDFNMARSLDVSKNKDLRLLGTPALERIEDSFGWTNALPGPAGTEVPTWPIGGRANISGRQLDHVFTGLPPESRAECRVVTPSDASDSPTRLSDHAMLLATVEYGAVATHHAVH